MKTSPFRIIAAVIVILAIAIGAFIAGESRHSLNFAPQAPPRVWTPVAITPEGAQMVQPNTRRMEFWTPSAKTKDFLASEGGNIRDKDKWEIIPNEERVIEFGKLLRSDWAVLGYRRTEVWGHGRTVLKPGWWWTMTVSTNYPLEKFVLTYRNFWQSSNAVFVEVFDNQGFEVQEGPRTPPKK